MIYKVQGDFDEIDFSLLISKVEKYFRLIYINKTLYIALISIQDEKNVSDIIKKIFRPARNFFVREITEKNIMDEEDFIADWCKDNFVSLEKQKFESERQEQLRQVWEAMDRMENELKVKIKEQKL